MLNWVFTYSCSWYLIWLFVVGWDKSKQFSIYKTFLDKFISRPYFGDAETDVTVQQGEAAFFNCHVFNLANQTVRTSQKKCQSFCRISRNPFKTLKTTCHSFLLIKLNAFKLVFKGLYCSDTVANYFFSIKEWYFNWYWWLCLETKNICLILIFLVFVYCLLVWFLVAKVTLKL